MNEVTRLESEIPILNINVPKIVLKIKPKMKARIIRINVVPWEVIHGAKITGVELKRIDVKIDKGDDVVN